MFAQCVHHRLDDADWSTRREIIRTLVRRIEIDAAEVRVVYKVNPGPFVEGPGTIRGQFQDRVRRAGA